MAVTLSGKLPKDASNGIGAIAAQLAADPENVHVVIALVDCSKLTTDVDTGETLPTARIRAIEAFPGPTLDAAEARRLWRRAMDRRNGQIELPIEVERALDALEPADPDPETPDGPT